MKLNDVINTDHIVYLKTLLTLQIIVLIKY